MQNNCIREAIDMNFLFTVSDSYTNPILLLMFSIYKNMGGGHTFYFIHKDISVENQRAIISYAKKQCQSNAVFVCFTDPQVSQLPLQGSWSEEVYFRLFAPYLLPDIKKVLYLDGDTLVTDSLCDLWDDPVVNQYPIGAVANDVQTKHKARLSLPDEATYINSGVLLMNLERIRMMYSEKDIWNKLFELRSLLQFPDQDFINIVFQRDLMLLDVRYNYMINLIERVDTYPKIHDHKICHFVLSKPWNVEFMFKTDRVYLKYLVRAGRIKEALSLYYQHRKRRWGTRIKSILKLR